VSHKINNRHNPFATSPTISSLWSKFCFLLWQTEVILLLIRTSLSSQGELNQSLFGLFSCSRLRSDTESGSPNVKRVSFSLRACNSLVLQPLRWRCVKYVIHHERDVREEKHDIYVAWTSNNRVNSLGDLYCCLLPRCEALRTCRSLGISDHNTRSAEKWSTQPKPAPSCCASHMVVYWFCLHRTPCGVKMQLWAKNAMV